LAANVIAVPMVAAIGVWVFCPWRPRWLRFRREIRPLVGFAFHTYGNFAVRYFARNLDNLLIGKFIGNQMLGYYKKAYDLFALPANQLTVPLSNVALSALSRYSDDHEQFRRYFLSAFGMISFISMGMSLVLTIASRDIILLILGPQWLVSAKIFMFFGPGIGFMLLYYTHGWLHLSLGRADRWFRWSIVELVVTASFIGIGLQFGAIGVAIAWTLSFFVLLGPGLIYAGKPASLTWSLIWPQFWRYLAAALASGFGCALILFTDGPISELFSKRPLLLRLGLSSLLGLLLYLMATVILSNGFGPFRQLISLLRTMKPERTMGR